MSSRHNIFKKPAAEDSSGSDDGQEHTIKRKPPVLHVESDDEKEDWVASEAAGELNSATMLFSPNSAKLNAATPSEKRFQFECVWPPKPSKENPNPKPIPTLALFDEQGVVLAARKRVEIENRVLENEWYVLQFQQPLPHDIFCRNSDRLYLMLNESGTAFDYRVRERSEIYEPGEKLTSSQLTSKELGPELFAQLKKAWDTSLRGEVAEKFILSKVALENRKAKGKILQAILRQGSILGAAAMQEKVIAYFKRDITERLRVAGLNLLITFSESQIHVPDTDEHGKVFPATILKSEAYWILKNHFIELFKNVIGAGATEVVLSILENQGRVWISLRDNGCGFPEAMIPLDRLDTPLSYEQAALAVVKPYNLSLASATQLLELKEDCGSLSRPTLIRVQAAEEARVQFQLYDTMKGLSEVAAPAFEKLGFTKPFVTIEPQGSTAEVHRAVCEKLTFNQSKIDSSKAARELGSVGRGVMGVCKQVKEVELREAKEEKGVPDQRKKGLLITRLSTGGSEISWSSRLATVPVLSPRAAGFYAQPKVSVHVGAGHVRSFSSIELKKPMSPKPA